MRGTFRTHLAPVVQLALSTAELPVLSPGTSRPDSLHLGEDHFLKTSKAADVLLAEFILAPA